MAFHYVVVHCILIHVSNCQRSIYLFATNFQNSDRKSLCVNKKKTSKWRQNIVFPSKIHFWVRLRPFRNLCLWVVLVFRRKSCPQPNLIHFETQNDSIFLFFFFWMLQEELVNNSTQTGRPSNTDENNNPDWMVFLNQNYECRLKSSTMGEMRLYPGHHKHAFTTCNRAIVSFVWANFQLIFISFDFGTICFAMIHVLIRVFHFMFGVCVADV